MSLRWTATSKIFYPISYMYYTRGCQTDTAVTALVSSFMFLLTFHNRGNMDVLCLLLGLISTIFVAVVSLLLCFVLYVHYLHKINDHLPSPPRSSFILGHLPEIWEYQKATGKTTQEYLVEKQPEYGPIFLLFFLHKPMVYLADPNYVRQVFVNNHKYARKEPFIYCKMGFIFGERGIGYGLVTSTDELLWRKRRHILNPAFHRKCLKNFMNEFNDVCDTFLTHIGRLAEDKAPATMVEEFAKITVDTISRVALNIHTNAIENPDSPFPLAIRDYLRGAQANFEMNIHPTLLSIFQFKLFRSASQNEQINAAKFLRKFASDCITTRMREIAKGNEVPDDFLSILIKDGNVAKDDIIDEFLTIFIAGQDTTANTLAFALYEIISNPHVEKRLVDEIEEVLGERDVVEFDDLTKLKYLGQVFDENQRRHTIVHAPFRILKQDIVVGNYQISKGTRVNTSTMFFGMNPKIWPEPKVFDPERFSDPGKIQNLSMTHFPFSIGPRNCIGQTFAKFESKVILAKLFQKFQFKLLPNQTDRMEERLTMTPRDGVICEVSRRK